MNKKLLAAALGLAFAAPSFAASNDLMIYGRIHQSFNHTSTDSSANGDTGGNFTLQNVSSRLGFRGEEDLGGGLKVLVGYEFQVGTDNSDVGGPSGFVNDGRHTYLGFKTHYGTFTAGTQDGGGASVAPLYSQASKIGSVSNNGGELTTVDSSFVSSSAVISAVQRVNNSFGYATKSGPLSVSMRHSMGGTNDVSSGATKENDNRLTEVAVGYTAGDLYIGGGLANVAYQASTKPTNSTPERLLQLVATYQLGALKLGGVVNQVKFFGNATNNTDNDTNFAISALYKLSGNTGVFAMFADGESQAGQIADGVDTTAVGEDKQQFQLSAYYDFSKRTRSYIGYERFSREAKVGAGEVDDDSIVLGLRHNF